MTSTYTDAQIESKIYDLREESFYEAVRMLESLLAERKARAALEAFLKGGEGHGSDSH